MRPTLHDPLPPDDSRRIISLGEVRRRRATQRRAPNRHYLVALLLIALAGWVTWAIVLFTVAPSRLPTYTAFLVPLWVALAASGSLGAYFLEWRQGMQPSIRACVRRGVLAATLVVFNLALAAAHRWSPVPAALSLLTAAGFELAARRGSE